MKEKSNSADVHVMTEHDDWDTAAMQTEKKSGKKGPARNIKKKQPAHALITGNDNNAFDTQENLPADNQDKVLKKKNSRATRPRRSFSKKDKIDANITAGSSPNSGDINMRAACYAAGDLSISSAGELLSHACLAYTACDIINPVFIAEQLCKIPALPPCVAKSSGKMSRTKTSPASRQPAKKTAAASSKTKKRMFISVIPGEQIEVGLAEDENLLEYYLDMLHQRKLKGNIYKGIIHNIDTNLQAAFIDFGSGKNGFLQIDEVHPEYWQTLHDENLEKKKFPPIQKVLKPGQELLVQVVKEPSGNKGAFLTTWLSLAGRFLVLTPGQEQIGVSRKVTEPEERNRLKELMNGIDPGNGMGVIVRTVGEGATKTTLKTDLQYLKRLWREIRKKATDIAAPALIYQEPGLSERSVRDYLTDEVQEIWVDNVDEANRVKSMVSMLFPRKKNLIKLYSDVSQSIWENFKLKRQLDQIYAREVSLPSGGRLVFDQTEALLAIDINSGKISGKGNFEAMAFKTNMEASEIIARQLRLRDIGGQVVIDFIEMKDKKHILEVEKNLRQAMKNDRARHDIARMSSFGLLELVRQRMGSSALSISMETCSMCGGTGLCRNLEWQALQSIRDLRYKMQNAQSDKYVHEFPTELGLYLLNYKRETLHHLEQEFNKTLEIRIQP